MTKLNVLCCNPNGGAFLYITRGWENAFKAAGHNFERWDGSKEQLINFKPDIYLGCSGWRQNYPQWARDQFNTKILIHVNPWGDTVLQPLPGEPNINESMEAIKWVESQKPDYLYCYGLDNDIDHMWNKWESNVAKVIPMPCGGDATIHRPVQPTNEFKCEIGFIGGYWPYKAINLNKYLLPALNKYDSKVYGWGGWHHKAYKGVINDNDVNKLFSSAAICPSIVEPHTSRYGIDIPERMFKVPLGGGFTICDPCCGIARYVNMDIFPVALSTTEYLEIIENYLCNKDKRLELKEKQRQFMLKHHTYFSRLETMLKTIGYDSQAIEMGNKVKELLAC